jgi:peptide deformylase
MAAVPIRLYGDQVLREGCAPVAEIDDDVRSLIRDLLDTVQEAEGLGLAAPQIGVAQRVIVVAEAAGDERKYVAVINPEIVSACGEEEAEEGCLSIPGIYEKVKRPQSVVVRGLAESGERVTVEAAGTMARAFCHEIDHLDGVLFVNKIGMVRKGLLKRRLSAIKKRAKELRKSLR